MRSALALHGSPTFEITADVLLRAYQAGVFPMAESADDPQLFWVEPSARGVLPLEAVNIPRRLARTIRQQPYEIRIDSDFEGVIDGCAAARPDRPSTWINSQIRHLYGELFRRGFCHTVEIWQDGHLRGGLYGVALGGAFFGESMFSEVRDASKIALIYLCARLIQGGFTLLDTQFVTDHLSQFGAIEIRKRAFRTYLAEALEIDANFTRLAEDAAPQQILDIIDKGPMKPGKKR